MRSKALLQDICFVLIFLSKIFGEAWHPICSSQLGFSLNRANQSKQMRTGEFHFGGKKWNAGFFKVEREDAYGRSEVESFDGEAKHCTLATLLDGMHYCIRGQHRFRS